MIGQSFSLMSGAAPPPWLSPALRLWAPIVAPCVTIWRRRIAAAQAGGASAARARSEEHTSELQSLMRISYAVFCLKKKTIHLTNNISLTQESAVECQTTNENNDVN